MKPPIADTVLLTRDLALAQLASMALPKSVIDWRQAFSSALLAITRETTTLVVDAAAGVPMARLLGTLFLDQRPGRRAVIVEPIGAPVRESDDPRVQVLRHPLGPADLAAALDAGSQFAAACLAIESLAESRPYLPAVSLEPASLGAGSY
jgi:hypothetical protein